MEHQQPRKYVLRTTCSKNGGFQKYQPLPPQEVFQHAYWVLGSEMDVMIMRKQTLFNRKTDWMFLPVYLTTNKGLIFVYITNDSGYILRVSSALKLNFEGTKKLKKQRKRRQPTEPDFSYDATIVLHFQFGELRLRFKNGENLRPWRTILLAAHQSQYGITKIGEHVAKELFPSTSLESVVSTKSVYPEDGDKDKTDKVEIHRHPMIVEPGNDIQGGGNGSSYNPGGYAVASSTVQSSLCSDSATRTSPYVKSTNDYSSFIEPDMEGALKNIEAESNESVLESALDQDAHGSYNPFSPAPKTSKSHLTSEVNVSFEDLKPIPPAVSSIKAASSASMVRRFSYTGSLNRSPPRQVPSLKNVEAKSKQVVLDQNVAARVPFDPVSPAPKTSKSHLTSEVAVSFEDFEPFSATSLTAAFETSPSDQSLYGRYHLDQSFAEQSYGPRELSTSSAGMPNSFKLPQLPPELPPLRALPLPEQLTPAQVLAQVPAPALVHAPTSVPAPSAARVPAPKPKTVAFKTQPVAPKPKSGEGLKPNSVHSMIKAFETMC